MADSAGQSCWRAILPEWKILPGIISAIIFLIASEQLVGDLHSASWALGLFVWLFAMILASAFGVVRHAESLAIMLGEPLGTLILTLSVIGMEVLLVAAVMLSGTPDPAMARDTMFAVVMIVLNGLLGISLLLGGWKHREQPYNLQGAVSFLVMLVPLSVVGLVLPHYVMATSTRAVLAARAFALIFVTIGLYVSFLIIQTVRHPDHFAESADATGQAETSHDHPADAMVRSIGFHLTFLIIYLLPVIVLSKKLAIVLKYEAHQLDAPQELAGLIVAILILGPEGASAIRAALQNRLQRSVNLLFGAALSTIALTVPAVVAISLATGKRVELGLEPTDQILLAVTLAICMLTCATGRTNVLNGLTHLVVFIAYIVLIFGV